MRVVVHHLLLGTIGVTMVGSPPAPPAPSGLPPMPSIVLAAPRRETPVTIEESPTSALSWDEAYRLARAIVLSTGRDIIISRVEPTGSMRPYFDENAVLLLEAAPYSALKVGDVVTFYHPQLHLIVVHRLLEKRGEVFWARGDHNSRMDSVYVTPENYRRRLVGMVYMKPGQPPLVAAAAASPGFRR